MTTGLRNMSVPAAALLMTCSASGTEARVHHQPHRSAEPVVVELYTAQGCSGCGKVDGVIGDLAAKKDLIPLAFSVDYWDYLGWEDTWAKSEFADRQRAYVARLKVREIYTPEIVVQGAAEAPAWDHAKVDGLIAKAEAQHPRAHPRIQFLRQGARVRIGGHHKDGAGEGGDVWLVRYNPDLQSVKVKSGDSKGQTVTVKNAVHELKKIGLWHGGLKTYILPKPEDVGLKTLILLQAPKGGRILAVGRN